ncbi:ArsR/SmtB family transcription factor [Kribbella deserti]|uniref:ArsR/SmtB family transcription factor n=1 Tax=Kribbella deserti TaxID=1926257 RepID=UPI0036D26008
MDNSLAERLARLEQRLSALESTTHPASRPAPAAPPTPPNAAAASGVANGAGASDGAGASAISAIGPPILTGETLLESLREQVSQPGAVLSAGRVTLPNTQLIEWQNAHPTTELLDHDWSTRASALAALAHPIRLKLLQEILRGRTSVTALGEVEGLGTSGQIYHHLRHLTAEGWLHTPTRATYTIPAPRLPALLTILTALQ